MTGEHVQEEEKESIMLVECEHCHKMYSDEAAVCHVCGAPRDIPCHECGVIYKSDRSACPNCGARNPLAATAVIATSGAATNGKSRIAAGVLALLLGGIGVHEFYLGNAGTGILMLLFCWTGIPALVGLVQGIIYLTETDEAFARALSNR